MKIDRAPRPEWSPFPRPGTRGVDARVHLITDSVAIAQLRFARDATIHEHPGERGADVICLSGRGFVSLGEEQSAFAAGDHIFWPAGIPHRLWTEGEEMETLMVERLDERRTQSAREEPRPDERD